MSEAYLGEVFDIHGGGLDLIFPHHENELAQSRCAHGTSVMANYWMHNGFVEVEGKKMSKSEGNFVTIRELLEPTQLGKVTWHKRDTQQAWGGTVLRLAMLGTHYRQPIDWTYERLAEAEFTLARWHGRLFSLDFDEARVAPEIVAALADDLNTPLAVSLIHELYKDTRSTSVKDVQDRRRILGHH